MYLFVVTGQWLHLPSKRHLILILLVILSSSSHIEKNAYDNLHNFVVTFALAWSMFECNVTVQCITGHNSWPGSAQLTSTAARLTRPLPWPGPRHLRSTHSRGTKIFSSLEINSLKLNIHVSHFAWSSKKGHPLRCPWLGSVCSGVYDILAVRVDTSDGHYREAFHPFYAKFLSWESPGVSVHWRLVLGTEVTVILCYRWLNPDLDSCPSVRSHKMAPAVDTLVAMTDAFEGIDRLAEGAPKTDGAPNFRRVSLQL